jgi:hypothetical protein
MDDEVVAILFNIDLDFAGMRQGIAVQRCDRIAQWEIAEQLVEKTTASRGFGHLSSPFSRVKSEVLEAQPDVSVIALAQFPRGSDDCPLRVESGYDPDSPCHSSGAAG